MRFLKTSEAAAMLNVSPNTLRTWERRFGFPKPQRSPGRHRLYTHGEIAGLRDALQEGLSISSAVSRAREGLTADTHSLVGALASFEPERADAAMEAVIALRTVDRAIEEVLLPSLDELGRRHGLDSAAWAFAAGWGAGWLRRARRLASPPALPVSLIVGDASRDELDANAPAIRALEVLCLRAGVAVFGLSARGAGGMSEALAGRRPDLVVIAGDHLDDDTVARWAYAVRLAAGPLTIATFRRGPVRAQVRSTGAIPLPASPAEARTEIMGLLGVASPGPDRVAEIEEPRVAAG